MIDWLIKSVEIYFDGTVAENIFRLIVFAVLIIASIVAAIRLVRSIRRDLKNFGENKICFDDIAWIFFIAMGSAIALVVAIMGVIVEMLILSQML